MRRKKRSEGEEEKGGGGEVGIAVKRLIRNSKNAIERQIAKDSKTNPKRFFSFVNSSRRSRSTIGPLIEKSNKLVTESQQQAEVMNEYFASVFTRTDLKLLSILLSDRPLPVCSTFTFQLTKIFGFFGVIF